MSSSSLPPIFSLTTAGYIVPAITGILSSACSFAIVNVIRKTPQRLSTTYHRIMTVMSIFDIIASISMALTTLPMPSDDILQFAGPMLGNKVTCQLQGYFIILGISGGGSLYLCLSWYFVCRMTLNMSAEKISKRIEPWFFVYSFFLAIYAPSQSLSENNINTSPVNQFCTMSPDHSDCEYSEDEYFYGCENQTSGIVYSEFPVTKTALTLFQYYTIFNVVMIMIAMIIIIWTISRKNRNIRATLQGQTSIKNESHNEYDAGADAIHINDLRYSRVLVVQALMYIFAYFITWVFLIIPLAIDIDSRRTFNVCQIFKSILLPMQGFWNLIIFVYDRAYLVYHGDEYEGFWKTIKAVLFRPGETTGIILPESFDIKTAEGEVMALPGTKVHEVVLSEGSSSSVRSSLPRGNEITSNISSSSSEGVIECEGVDYLGENNLRFYMNQNGLKRTGAVWDRRKEKGTVSSSVSIESPAGYFGDSVGSGSRSLSAGNYFLGEIQEEGEEKEEEEEKS